MVLSPGAREQLDRILRGRAPNPDKATLNEAIDFLDANPELRAQAQRAEAIQAGPSEQERAFLQIARVGFTKDPITPSIDQLLQLRGGPPALFLGPTRLGTREEEFRRAGVIQLRTPEEIRREGEVSQRVPPGGVIEQFEREATRARDVLTTRRQLDQQFTTEQIATSPLKGIEFLGGVTGTAAERATRAIAPEGITVTVPAREAGEFTFFQPSFGTITAEAPTGIIEIPSPARGERQVQIFEPSRVGTGVSLGTQAGLFAVAPAAVIAPGLVFEGVQTATDESLSTGQRLIGVAEAELGLLVGGLRIKSLVKDLPPLKIRELSELPSTPKLKIAIDKRGKAGKSTRQKTVSEAKEKATKKGEKKVTRKEVEEFLEVDVKIEGDQTKITLLGKGKESFNIKREKARFLIDSAKSKEARKEALVLVKEKYGEKFLADYLEQEGFVRIPEIRTSTLITQPEPPTPQVGSQLFFQTPSVFAGTGQFEQAQFVQQITPGVTPGITPVVTPRLGLLPGFASSLGLKSSQQVLQEEAQDILQATTQIFAPALAVAQVTAQDFAQDQVPAQILIPALTLRPPQQTFIPRQPSKQPPRLRRPPRRPRPPRTPRPPILLLGEEEDIPTTKPKPIVRKKGFFPEVKVKGEWKRIVPKPRTRKEALALAGKVVDETTAAQLRLIPAKKKAIKETLRKRIEIDKFRDFMKKKGKKIPLQNQGLIELRKFRIDTPSEKKQLSVAKFLKSKEFKKFTKPKKKKKTRSKPTSSPSMNQFLLGGGFENNQIKFFQ